MEKLNLFQKLLEIQKHIKGLGKDSKSFSYKYVSGDKVLEVLKPLMNELGIILKQEILETENVRMDYKTKNGEKTEVLTSCKMKFTWINAENPTERDENLFHANGMNDFEKGLGSALTYGERYFLLKYFHISTDEDDIDNPTRKEEVKNKEVKVENKDKKEIAIKMIKELINEINDEGISDAYSVVELNEMNDEELKNVFKALSDYKKSKVV